MPLTRSATEGNISSASSKHQQQDWVFPADGHLLITTPRHIFAWDSTGISTVFRSSRSGISAAREAKDGSGILAVASRNIVVLHDTTEGREQSWGLDADEDSVRYLEYSNDAKHLFLSTVLDGAVQRYSVERSKLLDATQTNASPLVALALSPTGQVLLSASANPSVIHLTDLARDSLTVALDPGVTGANVSSANFHPERSGVFLVVFDDGSVSAFDGGQNAENMFSSSSGRLCAKRWEIGHFERLHGGCPTTGVASDANAHMPTVSGATFLQQFKTRAVTVGTDGRCRLIDFAEGGVILRTWHVDSPLTAIISISTNGSHDHVRVRESSSSKHAQRQAGIRSVRGRQAFSVLIVVGRLDGVVDIFDMLGLRLAQTSLCSRGKEKVLSIEWLHGPSPKAMSCKTLNREVKVERSQDRTALVHIDAGPRDIPQTEDALSTDSLKPCPLFTVDHDESEAGTVRHNPSVQRADSVSVAIPGAEYQDLFSPVKIVKSRDRSPPKRCRPQLSNHTFVQSPQCRPAGAGAVAAGPRNTALFPSDSLSPRSESVQQQRIASSETVLEQPYRLKTLPLSNRKRHVVFKAPDKPWFQTQNRASPRTRASRLLADFRKLSQDHTSIHQQGTLAPYAAPLRPVAISRYRSRRSQSPEKPSAKIPTASTFRSPSGDQEEWPTDSNASSSFDAAENDIWFTSESEPESQPARRRRRNLHAPQRVLPCACPQSPSVPVSPPRDSTLSVDLTSRTPPSPPSHESSLTSESVRPPVPRQSSPSHRRAKPQSPTKRPITVPKKQGMTLTGMALDTTAAARGETRSPWTRLKGNRRATNPEKAGKDAVGIGPDVGHARRSVLGRCACPDTTLRIQGLENEIALLRGEVLALKAVIRRNGLSLPACLR